MIYGPTCKQSLSTDCLMPSVQKRKNIKKNVCRSCKNVENKKRRATPEYKEKRRIKAEKNREKINANARRRRYKLTHEEYENLTQIKKCQNVGCKKKATCIDHCHKSKKIRGVLCRECNLALGILSDDLVRITGLVDYLKAQ